MVDVFAFQETLMIEAILGIALLVMLWRGFRRWLQYKENIGRLNAEQAAELRARHSVQIERVEERLAAIEQTMAAAAIGNAAQVDARPTDTVAVHVQSNP
jgi:hypothetical protein